MEYFLDIGRAMEVGQKQYQGVSNAANVYQKSTKGKVTRVSILMSDIQNVENRVPLVSTK